MRIIMTIMLFACMAFIPMNAATLADKEVTLTVSSDGASKEEAIRNALRSAIEQTYGTFVSSNTTLVNDELAKDEIATISSGNIKKYKEVITETLPNGRVYVTLQATVSISKLVSYAKSKGATVEFDGASLASNIEKEMLDTQSQDKVLENLAIQLKSLFYHGYDYSLEVLDVYNPYSSVGVGIEFEVTASPNDNFKKAISLLHETLANLHVPTKQQVSTTRYCEVKIIEEFPDNVRTRVVGTTKYKEYRLRASSNLKEWLATIWRHLYLGINNYAIQDKVGVHSIIATNKHPYGEYYKSYDMLKEVEQYSSVPRDSKSNLFGRYLYGGEIVRGDYGGRFTIYRMKMKEKIYLKLESLSTLKQYGDFKIQSKGE